TDTADGKELALKVLRRDFAKDAKAVQRFVRGMKAARALSHPHLVALYNAGITEPHCWIAMEFVKGESLDQLARRGPVAWPRVLQVAVQIPASGNLPHPHPPTLPAAYPP